MKQSYNPQYHPPIPTLEIRLYSSVADAFSEPFLAILDTGSDASLMPLERLIAIGAEETAPGWLIGITGNRQRAAHLPHVPLKKWPLPTSRLFYDTTLPDRRRKCRHELRPPNGNGQVRSRRWLQPWGIAHK